MYLNTLTISGLWIFLGNDQQFKQVKKRMKLNWNRI